MTVLLHFLKISAILKATVIHGSHQVTSAPHREKDFPASSSDYSWAHCFPMSMFNCCKLLNVNCCKILIRTALPLVFDKILILEIYFENTVKFDRYKIWVHLIKATQSNQLLFQFICEIHDQVIFVI